MIRCIRIYRSGVNSGGGVSRSSIFIGKVYKVCSPINKGKHHTHKNKKVLKDKHDKKQDQFHLCLRFGEKVLKSLCYTTSGLLGVTWRQTEKPKPYSKRV